MPADPAVSVYIGTCELDITRARVPDSTTTTSGFEIASFWAPHVIQTRSASHREVPLGGSFARERENNYLNFYGWEIGTGRILMSLLLIIKNIFETMF